jgi:hypothetical protein
LIEKLAIEVIARQDSEIRVGKTYRVHSYKAILERRRAAGLEWVIKRKGIEFIRADELPVNSIPATVPDIQEISITGTVPDPPITGGVTPSIKGRGDPVYNGYASLLVKQVRKTSSTSASQNSIVREALARFGTPDEEAVDRLIRECRTQAPDCTAEDIAHFIVEKGTLAARIGSIANPIGFLLTAVPRCFAGDSYRAWCEARDRRAAEQKAAEERAAAELAAWRRDLEDMIANPDVSEEDRQLARDGLGITATR